MIWAHLRRVGVSAKAGEANFNQDLGIRLHLASVPPLPFLLPRGNKIEVHCPMGEIVRNRQSVRAGVLVSRSLSDRVAGFVGLS